MCRYAKHTDLDLDCHLKENAESPSRWVCLVLLSMMFPSSSHTLSSNIILFFLRTLVAHEKDPGSVPRTYMVTPNHPPLHFLGTPVPSSDLCRGQAHTRHTWINTFRQSIYIHKRNKQIEKESFVFSYNSVSENQPWRNILRVRRKS